MKQFVRTLVPVHVPDPIVRFKTDPGRKVQADCATERRGAERLSVFITTLG